MKSLTVKEVSEIIGISQQAIYKQIKLGKLNRGADKKIQFSELLRVYPDVKLKYEVEKKNSTENNQVEKNISIEMIKILEKQLQSKDEQILNLTQQVEKLLEMNRHLQTNFLPNYTGEKTASWWDKIFGNSRGNSKKSEQK